MDPNEASIKIWQALQPMDNEVFAPRQRPNLRHLRQVVTSHYCTLLKLSNILFPLSSHLHFLSEENEDIKMF